MFEIGEDMRLGMEMIIELIGYEMIIIFIF
jgi:hypothetical protein